ncbi:MAG TPA: hypothetical protein VGN82_19905 [Bosea sp. (in: a-proteobacteria)]|uniref:hypothetical protein n=1 Tax=Bosea sp. (in: a-proteobacteria) TaxID=1871050 RepID=UPI002E0EA5F9|nr:hypothetical protein [Bosea sp. (in: a-proteobacteria)]
MMLALAQLGKLIEKAGFREDQPRVPGGSGAGSGQWMYVEGYAQGRPPGMGDNGGPSLDPPEPPKDPPKDKISKTQAAKALAKEIARQTLRRAGPVGAVFMAIEAAHWLYSERHSIRSYQDEPKSLAELQQNAGQSRAGYENHHIVEQGAAESERFPRSMIDGIDNVVSVPKYKHHEITAWYSKPNQSFGMQSPRAYLRGRDWSEHVRVGHDAMRQTGVLK